MSNFLQTNDIIKAIQVLGRRVELCLMFQKENYL